MNKFLFGIDEMEEQHKLKGSGINLSHNLNKEAIKKKKESEKLINPKYVFEKTPKNSNKIKGRKPKEMESKKKLDPIKEANYELENV